MRENRFGGLGCGALEVPLGGTGVSGLTRGLATLPQGGSRSLQWSETGMEDPEEDPLAVHCSCVCSGSVLLEDLLGISRSRKCDLLSVLLIYPRIFFCVFIVYCRIVFCHMLLSVDCFGLVVVLAPPPFSVWPHLFCCAGHEKKRGEQLKCPLTFRLYV